MKMMFAVVLGATSLLTTPVSATVLYQNAEPLAKSKLPASQTVRFSSPVDQQGWLSFDLVGYNTLDGDNGYIDLFNLTINRLQTLSLAYDLGGGGTDRVYQQPSGTTINRTANPDKVRNQGGQLAISLPFLLSAGTNTLTFAYSTPLQAGGQGLADEAWSLANLRVDAPVPEPQSWALMLMGFGAMAITLRRRQRTTIRFTHA